jgi:hypothetical protein
LLFRVEARYLCNVRSTSETSGFIDVMTFLFPRHISASQIPNFRPNFPPHRAPFNPHLEPYHIPTTHQNATSLMFCRSVLRCLTSLGSSAFRITPQEPSHRRPTNSKPRFDSVRGCAPICNAYCQPRPRHFSQASPGGADHHHGVAICFPFPFFSFLLLINLI